MSFVFPDELCVPLDFEHPYQMLIPAQNSVKPRVVFTIASTPNDFEQILKLRQLAYTQTNKIPPDTPWEALKDAHDEHSVQLQGYVGEQIVATCRLTYCLESHQQFEHDQFFEYPAHFPPKDQTFEISRLCIHPNYKGTDMMLALFQVIGLSMSQMGRVWIIGSSTQSLLKIYISLGLKISDISYSHALLGHKKHFVFSGSVVDIVLSPDCVFPVWTLSFLNVYSTIYKNYHSQLPKLNSKIKYRLISRVYYFSYPKIYQIMKFIRVFRKRLKEKISVFKEKKGRSRKCCYHF